jgi:hypothetical protein
MSPEKASSPHGPEPGTPQPSKEGLRSPADEAPTERHYIYKIDPHTNRVISAQELDPITGERKEVPLPYYGSDVPSSARGVVPSSPYYGTYGYDPHGYYGYSAHPGFTAYLPPSQPTISLDAPREAAGQVAMPQVAGQVAMPQVAGQVAMPQPPVLAWGCYPCGSQAAGQVAMPQVAGQVAMPQAAGQVAMPQPPVLAWGCYPCGSQAAGQVAMPQAAGQVAMPQAAGQVAMPQAAVLACGCYACCPCG